VVALVAEQTGYPPELLDLDLDLEADLGIDTVKQAETFAAIRETYDIARDDNLALRDYPTLAHVIGFVRDRAPHTTGQRRPVAQARPVAADGYVSLAGPQQAPAGPRSAADAAGG
jgi:acyl carrier protein